MKPHRFSIEALEPRLVLDSAGLGAALVEAPLDFPPGSQIASTVGVAEVGQQKLFVEVLFLVPPGADAHQAAAEAVRAQGARTLQSAEYVLTGLVWDEFFDASSDNNFVVQSYNPANDPFGGSGNTALVASQQTWTKVPSSSFAFHDGGTTNRDPSLVRESPGPQYLDGFNDVGWARLAPGTLGVTWFDTVADEADMALNTRYQWSLTDSPGPNEIDLQTVMLHENGHVVGLGHSDDPDSVMQAYYGGVRRTLGQDDIDGISAKYPAGPVSPVTDLAVTAVAAPSSVTQGTLVGVQVTVQNVGNQDVTTNVAVTLSETPDGFPFTDQTIAGLTAGASQTLTFSWDTAGASLGSHTLIASIAFDDANTANNTVSTTVTVNEPVAGVTVGSISPNVISAGTTQNVVIAGTGFASGAQVTFENGSGQAPVATNVVVSSDGQMITATISTKSGGPPRDRVWDVRVTNPGGATGVLPGGLTVTVSAPLTEPDRVEPIFSDGAMLNEIAQFYATRQANQASRFSDDHETENESVDYVLTFLL